MHAAVVNVAVTDADAATAAVRDQVLPQVSGNIYAGSRTSP
jgi:hypothetical protein